MSIVGRSLTTRQFIASSYDGDDDDDGHVGASLFISVFLLNLRSIGLSVL